MKKDYIVLYRRITNFLAGMITLILGATTNIWWPFILNITLDIIIGFLEPEKFRFSDEED